MKLFSYLSCAVFATFLLAPRAKALCVVGDSVTSVMDASLPATTFEYYVLNGCDINNQQFLNDFYLPYFADAGISGITVPTGWTYSIQSANNVFGLANAGAIEFIATPSVGYYGSDQFSYTANYASGIEGPYLMDLTSAGGTPYQIFGDPLIPASPDALAALSSPVPEPSTTAVIAIALIVLALAVRKRRLEQRL